MTEFPLGEPVPERLLALAGTLPAKPAPVVLKGNQLWLEPLDLKRDVGPLFNVSNGRGFTLGSRSVPDYDADALVWRYLFDGPFESPDGLQAFLANLTGTANLLPLTVFDVETSRQVGMTAYTNNFPEHLKIELGHIWYSPIAQRTKANLEATYLMLGHAFELGYRRVEWKCDALNERSRRSALRMGFTFEGIQESHFIIKGRNRDTAWYRILAEEWPEVRRSLEAMLQSNPRSSGS